MHQGGEDRWAGDGTVTRVRVPEGLLCAHGSGHLAGQQLPTWLRFEEAGKDEGTFQRGAPSSPRTPALPSWGLSSPADRVAGSLPGSSCSPWRLCAKEPSSVASPPRGPVLASCVLSWGQREGMVMTPQAMWGPETQTHRDFL